MFPVSVFPADYFPASYFPRPFSGAVALPSSTLAGLIARFDATPALVSAIPGGLLPGVPAGPVLIPYAVITEVGEAHTYRSGAPGAKVRRGQYQVAVAATAATPDETLWAIEDLFDLNFSPFAIGAAPIEIRRGKVVSVAVGMTYLAPEIEPDKANRRVRRLVIRLDTHAAVASDPTAQV